MARYQHLPIFQAAYDLNLEIHRRTDSFPRAHRYTMGEKLKNMTLDFIDLVIEANSQKEKTEILRRGEILLERLKIHVRTCFDLQIMGRIGFEFVSRKIDEIARQLQGWKDWSLKNKA